MDLYLKINDEIKLRYRKNIVKDQKAVVLINHGFAEHIGRYEHVKNYLTSSGYSVYRYDLRGHGKTTGEKGYIDSYESFITDCHEMVMLIKKEHPNEDIFMLGHSMGGLVTCMYGLEYPYTLKGQIFSGPAVNSLPQVEGVKGKALGVLGTTFPKLTMRNVVEDDICSVDQVVKNYKDDPMVLRRATFKFLKEFLINGPKFVRKNIENYEYPCSIHHGEMDKIVPIQVGEYLYDNISSEDKEIKIYDDLYHEILNEDEKFTILGNMVDWMDERLTPKVESDEKGE